MAWVIEKVKQYLARRMRAPRDFSRIISKVNLQLLLSRKESLKGILLDCGCGEGENILDVARQISTFRGIIGLDIHLPTLRKIRHENRKRVSLICGDGICIPLRSRTVDVVISNQVIEHIREYDRYLAEIARVLHPGGLFLVATPNAHCPRNAFLKIFGHGPILRWSNVDGLEPARFRGHVQEFTQKELVRTVEGHGFRLLLSKPILPKPLFRGNLLFIVYTQLEWVFFKISRPFVPDGYSKNCKILFQLRGN